MKNPKKLFVVVEGIDGCGKTTIAKLLRDYLKEKGFRVFLTHEPSDYASGKKIKELIRKKFSKMNRKFWLTLFTQDRLEHIQKFILPKLNEGIVICDRYYYSTLAYQMYPREWFDYLQKYSFLKPDIIFVLDVEPLIALQRTEKRKKETTIFEKEKFLKKVRQRFLTIYKLKKKLKENIFLINAFNPLPKVFSDVKKITDEFLKAKNKN